MDPSLKSPLTHEFTASYGAEPLERQGIRRRSPTSSRDARPHRGLPGHDDRRQPRVCVQHRSERRGTVDGSERRRRSRTGSTRTRTSPTASTRRWCSSRATGSRTTGPSTATTRCSSRTTATTRARAATRRVDVLQQQPVDHRQLSRRRSTRRGTTRTAGCQSFQRNRLRIWSVYDMNGRWRRLLGVRSLAGRFGPDLQPGGEKPGADGDAGGAHERGRLSGCREPGGARPDLRQRLVLQRHAARRRSTATACSTWIFNYNIPVFRTLRPWIKFDVYNLFDNQKLIAWNTTVSQDPDDAEGQPRPPDRLRQERHVRNGDRQHADQSVHERHQRVPARVHGRALRRADVPRGDRFPVLRETLVASGFSRTFNRYR